MENNIVIEIPELQNISKSVIVKRVWLFTYADGEIPSFTLEAEGELSNVGHIDVNLKILVNSEILCQCKGMINEVGINEGTYIIKGVLISDRNILFGGQMNVHDTLEDAIQSIWRGNLIRFNIPDAKVKIAQMNENNLEFLTKLVRSLSNETSFYYGAFNDICQFSLTTNTVNKDLTGDNKGISIKVYQSAGEFKENGFNHLETSNETTGMYSTTTLGNNIFTALDEASKLEYNYIESQKALHRGRPRYIIEYDKAGLLQIGDVVKLSLTKTSIIKLLCLGLKVVVTGSDVTCSAQTVQIE